MNNAPKLRFKEFNDEWEALNIGDTLEIKSGKDQKNVECLDGKYPILGTGGEIGKTNQYLYNKESVLIGRKGTIDKPMYKNTPFWTVDTLFYSEIKSSYNAKLLYYAFQNINWKKYCEATGVPSLSKTTIEKIKYFLPSLPEQEKIASFLSLFDQKIELQDKKVESLKKYKKGMMQKIFSQEIRFKDENGENYPEWKTDVLESRGIIATGGTPPKEHPEHFENGEGVKIPWITPSDITYKKDIVIGERSLSEAGFEKQVTLDKDTLLITCIASIGKNAILREKGSCNQQINALTPNKDNNVDFLYYLIEKNSDYMLKYAGQTATSILNKKSLSMLKFKFPSLPEQEKIASFLSTIDKKIELEEKKLEKLKEYKKGLLQQMFV